MERNIVQKEKKNQKKLIINRNDEKNHLFESPFKKKEVFILSGRFIFYNCTSGTKQEANLPHE